MFVGQGHGEGSDAVNTSSRLDKVVRTVEELKEVMNRSISGEGCRRHEGSDR